MAEVTVSIGGRDFEVACRNGEEHYLQSAAQLLDNEASALNDALGRMPETRMLLMAGLMLADKTASLEDRLKDGDSAAPRAAAGVDTGAAPNRDAKVEKQLADVQAALAEAKAALSEAQAQSAEKDKAVSHAESVRDAAVKTMQGMVKRMEDAAESLKQNA